MKAIAQVFAMISALTSLLLIIVNVLHILSLSYCLFICIFSYGAGRAVAVMSLASLQYLADGPGVFFVDAK